MSQRLAESDRLDLLRLAAKLVLDDGFRPDAAVSKAVDLVAKGVEGEATLALAILPADPGKLDSSEVEALFHEMLDEHGLQLVACAEGGRVRARWLAELMLAGVIEPAVGAWHLWQLWETADDELTRMLQLHEDWESSVGADRLQVEREMLAFAPTVIEGANRRLSDHQ
jgi:hypothetical protein